MPGRLRFGRNRLDTRSRPTPVGRLKTDQPCRPHMLFRHYLPARTQEDTSHTHLSLHFWHSNPSGRVCMHLLPRGASRTARQDTRHRGSVWRGCLRCGPFRNPCSPRCRSRLVAAHTFPFHNSDSPKSTLLPQCCFHVCLAHMACRHPSQLPHLRRPSARPGTGCRRTPYPLKSTRQGMNHSPASDSPR